MGDVGKREGGRYRRKRGRKGEIRERRGRRDRRKREREMEGKILNVGND